MSCTTCGEHSSYAKNIAQTIRCQICGQSIGVPKGVKSFTCQYCGSIYDVTTPTLQENGGWVWPFVGGLIVGFIVFAPLGRAMVKTLGEATVAELEAAAVRRKAKITVPPGAGATW